MLMQFLGLVRLLMLLLLLLNAAHLSQCIVA